MEFVFENSKNTRIIFKRYLDELTVEQLNTIPEGFNNNIFWNIVHATVTPFILAYKLSGVEIPASTVLLVDTYRKGTKPERDVTEAEIEEMKAFLFTSLELLKKDYYAGTFSNFTPYTVSTNNSTLNTIEDALTFSNYHEGLHFGYIQAQVRAL